MYNVMNIDFVHVLRDFLGDLADLVGLPCISYTVPSI